MDDVTRPGVTQRVPIEGLADLDSRPRRAALAFVDERGPVGVPALVRHVDGRLLVGVARDEVPSDPPPRRAALVVDDGWYWFELRAIVRRGTLDDVDAGPGREAAQAGDEVRWFAFATTSGIAWDYGRLHEERAE
jgi:hypothetical protein